MKRKKILLVSVIKQRYPHMSRDEIVSHIHCGEVFVDDEKTRDPYQQVESQRIVEIRESKDFVSRGGDKLKSVWKKWNLTAEDRVFVDAGSAKGGFTDFLLRHGASLVYAVDVGYNQLDYKLRKNSRVVVMERTNVRSLETSSFEVPPDSAVVDLSFRSILGVASLLLDLVTEKWILVLIKPQFEWKNPSNQFSGVIQQNKPLVDILSGVVDDLWKEKSFVTDVEVSPIRGRKGNREFFFLLKDSEECNPNQIKDKVCSLVFER